MALDLTGFGSIADLASKILDRFVPDPAQKAAAALDILKAQQAGEFKEIDAQLAEMQAQTSINQVEAASSNLFVSGWRPACGWIGAIGMGYQWLIVPLATFAYTTITGHALPVQPPTMDPNLIMLVGGLLGIHIGARTYEKVKGLA